MKKLMCRARVRGLWLLFTHALMCARAYACTLQLLICAMFIMFIMLNRVHHLQFIQTAKAEHSQYVEKKRAEESWAYGNHVSGDKCTRALGLGVGEWE